MISILDQSSDSESGDLKKNASLIVATNLLTKTGDALANPKTVLTWMLGAVGSPEALIGMLVPIRESGSMLPQIYFARWIREKRFRKGVWTAGSLAQGASVVGIGLSGYFLEGKVAGISILALLACFSLSRSLCSITSKDVLGKTIPKSTRGRVTGISASLSNFLVMGVGLFLIFVQSSDTDRLFFSGLVVLAGFFWWIAAGLFQQVDEPPSEIEEESNGSLHRLKQLWNEPSFVRFVVARGLLLATALSAPYYVRIVQEGSEGSLRWLGIFIVAQGLAVGLSGFFWGKLADRSSRLSMVFGGLLASVLGIGIGAFTVLSPENPLIPWVGVVGFFLLGIAHNGVRVGRKTYVVNLGEGNKRTDYVSVSNTLIGLLLLVTGSLGALSTFLEPGGILIVLAVSGMMGSLLSMRLPDVEKN